MFNPRFDNVQARRRALLFLAATLGAIVGLFLTQRAARACDCAEPQWQLQLSTVSSSDPTTTHEGFWPSSARLSGYTGNVTITSNTASAAMVGTVYASERSGP